MKYHTGVPVGRGGMGEVVRAWDPTLSREVALKFLRSDDPELEERMVREARAQARVSHPNICPVYEVGRHDGRVFIAMQFVDGRPLDEAARNLNLEQKVVLVRTVAEAVHAANTAGLVHRDLKPANILVETTDDGALKPWVLDFGIARERGVEGATVTGQVLGTPGYLSPEQARGEATTIDRRTDVFSLGVVLYELLAGCRPHPGDSEVEVLVSLLDSDPVPLRRVAPSVPRDLATVVMTCLEHDRERRYSSARELAEDLGRFLVGEPVAARPAGPVRRLVARARRHPATAGLLGGAAVVVVLLAIGLIGSWVKYTHDLRRERDLAKNAQRRAEEREREATQITDSLAGLFELADPTRAAEPDLTARELLARGEQRLESELGEHPLRLAQLLDVIASSYLGLGVREESERVARRALALRRQHADDGSLEVADSLVTLALAMRTENMTEAATLLREALAIRHKVGDSADLETAKIKARLVEVLLGMQSADEEIKTMSREALETVRRAGVEDTGVGLLSLEVSARVMMRQGRFEQAESLFDEVVQRRRELYGDEDRGLAATLHNLSLARQRLGDLDGAAAASRAALDLLDRTLSEEHPSRLQVMQRLAGVCSEQGQFDEAETLLREVVRLRRRSLGENHWLVGSSLLGGIGHFLIERRQWNEAEREIRAGVEVYEIALGTDHNWTAAARGKLAACLYALGRTAEAKELAELSLSWLGRIDGLPPPMQIAVRRCLEYHRAAGYDEMAAQYQQILDYFDRQPVATEPSSDLS